MDKLLVRACCAAILLHAFSAHAQAVGGQSGASAQGSSGVSDSDLNNLLGQPERPPAPLPTTTARPRSRPRLQASLRRRRGAQASGGDAAAASGAGEAQVAPAAASESADKALPIPAEQAQTGAGSTEAVRNRVIEEIVVTAEKREENIQEVPISIQAFSGDALAARGVTDTSGLQQTVPSLQFTNQAGFTLIFLRGIGTDNPIPSADRDVATYVDGIFMPSGQSTVQSLGEVQRVEVLKGPQGTLFGRNSTGGAISVVTEEPGEGLHAGYVEAEGSNLDGRAIKGSVMSPVTDWLSFSVSGSIDRKDFYYRDVNYQIEADSADAVRAKVNFHPTSNFKLGLTFFHSDDNNAGSEIAENTAPSLLGKLLGIKAQPSDYVADSDFPARARSSQSMLYGNVAWNLPWFDVKLIGGSLINRTPYTSFDFDGSPLPLVGFDGSNEFSHQQTGELQIVSNADSWQADKLRPWTIGLYYFHSNIAINPAHIHLGANAINAVLNLENLGEEPPLLSNAFNNLGLQDTPLGNNGLDLSFAGGLGTRSYSAYTQSTYSITHWLDLTLGGRYQEETRFVNLSQTDLITPNNASSIPLFSVPLTHAVALNFAPKVELGLHPNDSTLVYVSYSVGYKSGTYNLVNIYTPPNYIVPEKISTYEAGMKGEFFDDQLKLNSAVFYNNIRDLQTSFISLLSGGALRFETAPAARTLGAEFDSTLVPIPAWDPGLAVTANGAYVKANYTDFPNGSGFAPGTGLFEQNQDFTGHRMVYAPKFSGGLGLVQERSTSAKGKLRAGCGPTLHLHNLWSFFADAASVIKQTDITILSGRVDYLFKPFGIRVTAFGTNLLGRKYFRQMFSPAISECSRRFRRRGSMGSGCTGTSDDGGAHL